MKRSFYFLLIMCAAVMVASCGKTKSYTDMLKDERKAIDRLIAKKGFEILSDFPKDSVFKANQFVKLDNGLYLNIINKGNKERAVLYSTKIMTRFKAYYLQGQDSIPADIIGPTSNEGGAPSPVEFIYGTTTSANPHLSYVYDMFICQGFSDALEYVGDSSYVSLIVPFKLMNSSFEQDGMGVYYEKVKFIFK